MEQTENKDKIFQKMNEIAERVIKHYKSDFTDYDINTYGRMYENTPFIWIVRKCGTYIVGLASKMSDCTQKAQEETREFATCIIEHYTGSGRSEDNHFFLIYKGKSIKEIDGNTALKMVKE